MIIKTLKTGATILSLSNRFKKLGNRATSTHSPKSYLAPVAKPALIVRESTFQKMYSVKKIKLDRSF